MQKFLIFILIASCFCPQLSTGQYCDSACLAEIEGAKSYTTSLHDNTHSDIDRLVYRVTDLETKQKNYDAVIDRITTLEYNLLNNITRLDKRIGEDIGYVFGEIDTVKKRVSALESNEAADDSAFGDLSYQLSNLEKTLKENTNTLSNQISNEITGLNSILSDYIASVNRDLSARIDRVSSSIPTGTPRPPTNTGGNAGDVYRNLTRRIDNLEYTKISSLSTDNERWRQNFRVVNATFEKLKKNYYATPGTGTSG